MNANIKIFSKIKVLLLILQFSILSACSSDNPQTDLSEGTDLPNQQIEVEPDTPANEDQNNNSNTETPAPEDQTILKIMPLGDSITQANLDHKSYRYSLWKRLVDSQVAFDFLGSMQDNFKGNPHWPEYKSQTFDQDHEGHWGWRVDEILENIDLWLEKNLPDVVLIHLGTNDIFQKQSVKSTLDELKELINQFRTKNADITILLAKVIPSTKHNELLNELNKGIENLSKDLNSDNSPVYLVNAGLGFDPEVDTYDGVHPNASGEDKMAAIWFDSLMLIDVFR